jgi:hypothetical protein
MKVACQNKNATAAHRKLSVCERLLGVCWLRIHPLLAPPGSFSSISLIDWSPLAKDVELTVNDMLRCLSNIISIGQTTRYTRTIKCRWECYLQ